MRRWYLPLTVLGLGGIGAFLISDRGRAALRRIAESFSQSSETWLDWNDSFENELDRIRGALNQIADSLDPRPEPGH